MNFTLEQRDAFARDPHVKARMLEFMGSDTLGHCSAVSMTVGNENACRRPHPIPLEELPSWRAQGAEVFRSHWDRTSLICHLDLEYVNFDDPAHVYRQPGRVFELQLPLLAAAEDCLGGFGIRPLVYLTGRGFHLVWRASQTSHACDALAQLGHLSPGLRRLYATHISPTGDRVSTHLGSAFAGLGLLMEYLAHAIKRAAGRTSELPVEFGAIEAGPREHGREILSLDITEYADPLSARDLRVPFTPYLKHSQHRHAFEPGVWETLPPIMVIPLDGLSISEALHLRSSPKAVMQLAERTCTEIPEASDGMGRAIDSYRQSRLAELHNDFYALEHEAPEAWEATYDQTDLSQLPKCASCLLEHPNDLLLRPACAQRLVRVLLALGWHPRHIAGLIRSKYERNHDWGIQWDGYDPATRADFYARVFSGLIANRVDDLVDFNCQSAREEGLCFHERCDGNLLLYRDSLLARRTYERLGCRPFHRLFLPAEHPDLP